jgi:hypothetical protein
LLAKSVITKPTPPRPDGITLLGCLALLAGVMLLIAGITFALPSPVRWDYGPAFIGAWIVMAFGYFGFAQFLPTLFVPAIGIPVIVIVILAILYLAAGIGFFSGRRWAWTLGITLALFGVASGILQIIWAQDNIVAIPGPIVTLLIFIYLTTPLARNFFFKPPLSSPRDKA